MRTIDRDLLLQGIAYVDRWVAYRQELREIPGVVVAIGFGDDLLLSRGYGLADLEKRIAMTPQHIFRVASHSKTFTATAVMQLVEQGELRLDDRVGRHIPWLRDGVAEVTIRQVLNHSAGIIRDGNQADYWQLDEPFPNLAHLQHLVEDGGLVLAANEHFKYSNIGYALLGVVVETAGGMPYNEYVTRHIVDRLQLHDTGPETHADREHRLATGYMARRPALPRRPVADVGTGAMSAATGFYSTAEDLCRYGAAHFLGNEELLTDASKREMQQPYWTVEQADEHYGLGFAVTRIGKRRLVGHGGGFPGHATRTWIDPVDRLVVVVLTNETGGPAAALADSIVKIIDFALSREPSSACFERFVGRFANMWGVVDVAQFGDALVALDPDEDDPVKHVTELNVEDEETVRIDATNGYASRGQTMRYLRDADGRIAKVVNAGMSSYPVEVYRERLLRPHDG